MVKRNSQTKFPENGGELKVGGVNPEWERKKNHQNKNEKQKTLTY